MRKISWYISIFSAVIGASFFAKTLLRSVGPKASPVFSSSMLEEVAEQQVALLPAVASDARIKALESSLNFVYKLPFLHPPSIEDSEFERYGHSLERRISREIGYIILNKDLFGESVSRGNSFNSAFQLAAVGTHIGQNLSRALAYVESRNDPCAYSSLGAIGLKQLRPLAVKEVTGIRGGYWAANPEDNVFIGALYLERLFDRFGGIPLALAAYNLGPRKVDDVLKRYKRSKDKVQNELLGIPETTKSYVAKVLAFERLFGYGVFDNAFSQGDYIPDGFFYTVRRGDTLSHIARRCGVSVADILALNDVAPQRLRVGQKILVRY